MKNVSCRQYSPGYSGFHVQSPTTLMFAILWLISLLVPNAANADSTIDYLVQMVCVDSNNQPIYGDPYLCESKRKLNLGEKLPYHKIDYNLNQISDSFPVADDNGITKAIQSYFFLTELNTDPLFPNQVHLNPLPYGNSGGYNIIGADSEHIFFRGTSDPSATWQPWYTPSCATAGWLLLPVAPMPIGYGGTNSPTINYPNCSGSPPSTNASTVEWNYVPNYEYASGKTLPSIYNFHYSAGYDALEVNYFTKVYGVTRWEAWQSSSYAQGPGAAAMFNCPGGTYTANLHNKVMYMQDCRDWTKIIQPAEPWDPNGTSPIDSTVLTWPIDPLYTSGNLLVNTHIGGNTVNPPTCDVGPWSRAYTSPNILNWSFVNVGQPFTGSGLYTCVLQFSVPQTPSDEVVFQRRNIEASFGRHSYGVMLWTQPGSSGEVDVAVFQLDGDGNRTGIDRFLAHVNSTPHTFTAKFVMNPETRALIFAMYPRNENVPYNFTGAWIAKMQ